MGKLMRSLTLKNEVRKGAEVRGGNTPAPPPAPFRGWGCGVPSDRCGSEVGVKVREIAYRVERLTPSPRNPLRFHEDKSEILAELHRLAMEV